MGKIKKWYYSSGREDMPDGLNLIEVSVEPSWLEGYRFEEWEYISDWKLGNTPEECLLKVIERLKIKNKFMFEKLSKEEQDKQYTWLSCRKHLKEIVLNEQIGKCEICE